MRSRISVQFVALSMVMLILASVEASACIGSDGSLPPNGGSRPNGIMTAKINAAWNDAAAKGLKGVITPPVSGTHPAVIILINNPSNGLTFAYPTASLWSQRLADIADYYTEVSDGHFTISAAAESYGTSNDGVIGPVVVSGLSSSSDITGDNSGSIAVQAIRAANAYINFASFDTDSSGTIEPDELHVLIYQAGYETSYGGSSVVPTPRAWAHELWQTPQLSGLVPSSDSDGVKIISYCYCGSQFLSGKSSTMATMGQMTHELGHDIGLPDLYDTDGTSSGGYWEGLGFFSLMASGSWGGNGASPVHVDGYLKSWLGWATVTTLTAPGDQAASLAAANGSNAVLRINVPSSQEFFIVENRQLTGYDTGLGFANGGLAVYHCDGAHLDSAHFDSDTVNVGPTDFGIAVEEADGDNGLRNGSDYGEDTDLFRSGNKTTFNASTTPNSNLKTGSASNVSLSSISASAATMTLAVGTPVTIAASISAPSVAQTETGPVTYTVTYTNAATVTLSTSDVSLASEGTATGTVSVSGSGTLTRTITISDITGEGRLSVAVAAGTANDGQGHSAPAIASSTGFWVGLNVPVVMWPAVPALLAAGWALLRRPKRG